MSRAARALSAAAVHVHGAAAAAPASAVLGGHIRSGVRSVKQALRPRAGDAGGPGEEAAGSWAVGSVTGLPHVKGD